MAGTAYDVLGLSPTATPELVEQAYKLARVRFDSAAAAGDEDARNRLVAMTEAYRLLSSQERRTRYDSDLAAARHRAARRIDMSASSQVLDSPAGGRTSLWLVGLLIISAVYAGQRYFGARDETRAPKDVGITVPVDNNQRRAEQDAAAEERRARDAAARELQRNEQIDAQRRAMLDGQSREQERRDAQQRNQERQATERAGREEAARIEKERRYYTCMNSTFGPTVSFDRARQACGAYR